MRILVISPHADDAELGVGASISRYTREGHEVYILLLATSEKFPEDFPIKDRLGEFKNSMKILGVNKYFIEDYPVRELYKYRQRILDKIIKIRHEISPDAVFIPSLKDIHQDHQIAAMEGYRAFNRKSTILSYEIPWNSRDFNPNYFISINDEDLKKKIDALMQYKSQILLNRPYINEAYLRSQAIFRGVQSGNNMAEAFELLFRSE
jgi:LmbE family N-acetylglucosaminyl deacetylase